MSQLPAQSAAATLTFSQVRLLLIIVVAGMLLAGGVVIIGRVSVKPSPGSTHGSSGFLSRSVVRSWIAISLVMGLLVFCATSFLIDDASLRSILFGGLIANVGAAVAFYFASKSSDQARSDILNATMSLAQGGIPPTGFTAMTPPNGQVAQTYIYPFAANGQPSPRYNVATGQPPPGLILGVDGMLRGTPTTQGQATFSVLASNSAGSVVSPPITLTVDPAA